MKLYLAYLNIQQRFRSPDNSAIDRKKFYTENILIIRWWTLLGPTTNRTLLILSALLGNVEMFLWLILIPGNLWLVVCLIYQKMIDKKIATRMA
ncbi:MAG: hypothetical protein EPO24_08440 [Bacteroidetes bacterium]|nr:MAG: hypothetical protein EPO24_08440 [Bacteroidota bacterium]